MVEDGFDEMLETADQPLVMSIVIHSFITGQPFRLRPFVQVLERITEAREDVWLTTPGRLR